MVVDRLDWGLHVGDAAAAKIRKKRTTGNSDGPGTCQQRHSSAGTPVHPEGLRIFLLVLKNGLLSTAACMHIRDASLRLDGN